MADERKNTPRADDIIERAVAISHGELREQHPAIMSCGGIYLPRPRPCQAQLPLFHILHTANDLQPSKIVSAIITSNVLDDVLCRECLN
ncbi:MAG: hypothetical protein HYV02_07560 [Deltaproteobacteria bacterium]|nr:hypothetical protein [Deltaproteobacteria bacterium]